MSTATPDGGVIFDLDGVIIDSEALQHRAYNQVLQRFGIQVDAAVYGREWIAAGRGPEYAVRELGLPISATELRRLKDPVYHALMRSEIQLVAGAREALERLGPRFPLAVATNSGATDVAFVLEHFALAPLFTAVVTREHYVEAKPARGRSSAAIAIPARDLAAGRDIETRVHRRTGRGLYD